MGRGRKSRRNLNTGQEVAVNVGQDIYPTAIYVRLSVENLGRCDNGATIENQKDVCREFIKECPDLQLVKVYEDNGWSGTVMHRPAFEELMEDVKHGIIKAVVVRDLSRFARNYIEAGTYLESVFPDLGVRFISVKEQLDTLKTGNAAESLIVPFQNLINDLYAKDISRKVESAKALRIREGTIRWSGVPYGYKKNDDHTNIVPDEMRAGIVRQIFEWKADGISTHEIARRLNKENAPKPNIAYCQNKPWNTASVRRILRNHAYIGIRICGVTHTALYKGLPRHSVPSEDWHITPDAHEALVSRELFDRVQELMETNNKGFRETKKKNAGDKDRDKLKDFFRHKIFCADCGKRLYFLRRTIYPKTENSKWIGLYQCSTYANQVYGHNCTSHCLTQQPLNDRVLAAIQMHIRLAVNYEKLIVDFRGSEKDRQNRAKLDTAIRKASQKLASAQRKRKRLYEDYVEGILDETEYRFAKTSYEKESETWNRHLDELVARRTEYHEAMSSKNKWVKAMRSVNSTKQLTQEIVDATIERINVYDGGEINIIMKYQDIFEFTKECLEGGDIQCRTIE